MCTSLITGSPMIVHIHICRLGMDIGDAWFMNHIKTFKDLGSGTKISKRLKRSKKKRQHETARNRKNAGSLDNTMTQKLGSKFGKKGRNTTGTGSSTYVHMYIMYILCEHVWVQNQKKGQHTTGTGSSRYIFANM